MQCNVHEDVSEFTLRYSLIFSVTPPRPMLVKKLIEKRILRGVSLGKMPSNQGKHSGSWSRLLRLSNPIFSAKSCTINLQSFYASHKFGGLDHLNWSLYSVNALKTKVRKGFRHWNCTCIYAKANLLLSGRPSRSETLQDLSQAMHIKSKEIDCTH